MKTLKGILEQSKMYATPDTERFVAKHAVSVKKPTKAEEDDNLFKAANIKAVDRETQHGYNAGSDEAVYEETDQVDEKKLTSAEMKKREEVARAIERENPKMPMGKKMAIATATAKKVAEEVEQVNEVSLALAKRARDKAEKHVEWDEDDMRDRPEGHSEKQRSKFQRYIDKKEPRAKGDRDWDPPKKNVKEETELDEAARHDQYSTYHAGVKDMLKKLGAAVDAHKEAAMSPTDYNKEKGGNLHSGHVYAMKNMHRTLQDMHDNLQQDIEYAQPPKPMKLKEEVEAQSNLSEEVEAVIDAMFEEMDENEREEFLQLMESDEGAKELLTMIEEALAGEEE